MNALQKEFFLAALAIVSIIAAGVALAKSKGKTKS